MKKRFVSMLLSSVLVVSSLAACGETPAEGSDATSSAPAAGGETGAATGGESGNASGGQEAEAEPYNLEKIRVCVDGTFTANVENDQQAFIDQWEAAVGEKIGHPIELEFLQLDHSKYSEQVSQTLTINDPGDDGYPDVLIMSASMYREYQTEGILWDMTEAYENAEFQSRITIPMANEAMKDNNGRLYGFTPANGNGCVTYVKQSWLDKAGIKIDDIKTFDDYYNFLKTFADGKTYGTIAAGYANMGEAPFINYLPEFWQDAYPAFYQKPGTTEWIDGFQEPAMVDALNRLKQGVADGVIDPDTEDASTKTAREKFFSNDQSTSEGAFTYWAGTWYKTLTDNMKKNEVDNELGDDRLVQLPPIKEITDSWGGYLNREAPVWVITDDFDGNDAREQAIFDAFIETMLDGGKVQALFVYGAEDVHWSTKAETFTLNAGTDSEKTYTYEDGTFHLRPTPNDPNTLWKKNAIDPVLLIAPFVGEYEKFVDLDPLVVAGNEFFAKNNVNAPKSPSCSTLTEYNSDLTDAKKTLINKVVMGEMSAEDAIAQYQDDWGEIVQSILDELNAQ